MRALITDGNERAALAAARSMVAAGLEVHVAAPTRFSLAGVSRGVRPCLLRACPLLDPLHYTMELGRVLQERRIDLLLPLSDPSVEAVLEHRAVLPDEVILPLPDLTTYRAASDKLHVYDLARRAGFAVPEPQLMLSAAD